jgi:hypothetical protein
LSHLFYLMVEMQGLVVNCSSGWKKAFWDTTGSWVVGGMCRF